MALIYEIHETYPICCTVGNTNALDPFVVRENGQNMHGKGLSMKIFMVNLLLLQLQVYYNSIGAYALLGIL